jgi:tetratricopeptide (TPR) repeat protein
MDAVAVTYLLLAIAVGSGVFLLILFAKWLVVRRRAGRYGIILGCLCAGGLANYAAFNLNGPIPMTSDPRDYFGDGMAAMQRREYDMAAELFSKYVAQGGDRELGWSRMAECYYYQGNDPAALSLCDFLGASVPRSGGAHYVRGLVFKRQGRMVDALEEWRIAAAYGNTFAKLRPELRRAGT